MEQVSFSLISGGSVMWVTVYKVNSLQLFNYMEWCQTAPFFYVTKQLFSLRLRLWPVYPLSDIAAIVQMAYQQKRHASSFIVKANFFCLKLFLDHYSASPLHDELHRHCLAQTQSSKVFQKIRSKPLLSAKRKFVFIAHSLNDNIKKQ